MLRYYDYFFLQGFVSDLSICSRYNPRATHHTSFGYGMDVNNVSIMSEEFRRMRQFVDVLQVCRVTSRVVSSSVYVETMFGCSELHSQLLNDSSMASRSLFGMGRSNDTGGFSIYTYTNGKRVSVV